MSRTAAAVFALLAAAPLAHAVVLCARPGRDGTLNTTVKIRPACKPPEQQLDAAALGLQGPPGPQGAPGVCECSTTTTTTPSTTTTTLAGPGTCSFKGTPCSSDADCGLPGICFGGDGGVNPAVCHQRCDTNADCTAQTFCFASGIGSICVGCGQPPNEDSAKCTAYGTCQTNDCKSFGHPECTGATGAACTFPDRCVLP